jgi:hypothetical protein
MVNQNPYAKRPKPTAYTALCAGLMMTYFALMDKEPLLFFSLAGCSTTLQHGCICGAALRKKSRVGMIFCRREFAREQTA